MVSSISFKMRQLLIMLIMLRSVSSVSIVNTEDSEFALRKCVNQRDCSKISTPSKCNAGLTMGSKECTVDISRFSQKNVTAFFEKFEDLGAWLFCDNSSLSDINLSKGAIGMHVTDIKREASHMTFTIVNNVNLRSLILPDMSQIKPGFFKIWNNPRLSRLSLDNIRQKLDYPSALEIPALTKGEKMETARQIIRDKTVMQKYGECDYKDSGKFSLTWPQFRWCRTIPHDVILEGPEFKSGSDPAYILNVTGSLTIKNTNITDLSILPVYFRSKGGEIIGNEDLCISFEDEIRMKRLGFKMENNKPLSCRTTCDGGTLSLQTIMNRKDCVILNGGLILEGINATTAAADFFKTIRVINGPVVITNANVTVDFKELKEINLAAGENSPHISLTNCAHPILFPNLTTLNGTEASPMVVLDHARIDIFNFLNRTYTGKIRDLSRENMLETTTSSGGSITSASTLSNNKLAPGTVTHGNRLIRQSTEAPVEQRDDREADTNKPHDTPVEKQVEPSTAVSPVRDTDQGAAKNSNLPSQEDPNNSAVEGKSNVLMVMTIVSLVVFIASSATSVGIIIKYSVM